MKYSVTSLVATFFFIFASTFAAAQDSIPGEPSNNPVKAPQRGSIRDINAIGNRNVGCGRGLGNWYSLEKQIQMGKEFAQQIETTSKFVTDPAVTEFINRIGQNLVRNSDSLVPFTIKVVDSDEINAFALPGGFFYVDSGLILAADNEAELVGVMAHEIAHVAACHAARENTRSQLMNLASVPLIFVGGGIGYAVRNAAGLGMPLTFLKFTRGFESEADYLGLEYVYKAGYDPQAFTAFFEKVQNLEKQKTGRVAKAFSTHPQTPDRIAKSQAEINTVLPAREQYKVDTSEFEDVKVRLAAIENRHKIDQGREMRPTLRRASHPNASDEGKSSDDNDRPKLKRRNNAPDR